jgi:hypothetical protein
MAGSPVPIARVTRASARVAVDEDALARRRLQVREPVVPIASAIEASYVPIHLRPFAVEGLRRTAIELERAAIEEENAAIEREALMLGRDCSAREASTLAHEKARRARQLQWEASNPPVIMDTEAVLPPGQEVLTHEEDQVQMVSSAMKVSRERAIVLLRGMEEQQRLHDEEVRILDESRDMEEAAVQRRQQEEEQEELRMARMETCPLSNRVRPGPSLSVQGAIPLVERELCTPSYFRRSPTCLVIHPQGIP